MLSYFSFLELASFAVGLVKERPLDQWKETLAVLCSHSNSDEFQGLCDALARRLSGGGLTHAATLCWICAAKVDQALHVWTKELLSKQASVSELQVRLFPYGPTWVPHGTRAKAGHSALLNLVSNSRPKSAQRKSRVCVESRVCDRCLEPQVYEKSLVWQKSRFDLHSQKKTS